MLAVGGGKEVAVTECQAGKVVATSSIGDSPDAAGFDAKNQLAFSSNGDGTLTVVDAGSPGFNTLQNLATQKSAKTMTFDSATGRIYLSVAELGPRPAPTPQHQRPLPPDVPRSFTT